MKNNSMKLTIRYLLIIIVVVIFTICLNYTFFLIITRYSPLAKESKQTISTIANQLDSEDKKLDKNTVDIINKKNLWVQLIAPKGDVIFNYNIPKDVYNHYSYKQVANMSKGYLNDYPVFLWESGNNLAIVGYPKGSLDKYSFYVPSNMVHSVPATIILILLFNLIITLILAYFIGRKVNKPLSNILNGILMLKNEKQVEVKENGIFKELSESITETSDLILKKNTIIQKRNTAVSNWIASISHDIRTPLSMILGYSNLITEDENVNKQLRSQAKIIAQNADKIKDMVSDLNLATSLQYNLLDLNAKSVNIVNIVKEAVIDCINRGVADKDVVNITITNDNIYALVNKDLIIRAIVNLITNSCIHNNNQCNISVVVSDKSMDGFVSIIISDDGIGIPPDKIDLINSYDYTDSWINKSHGLGLVIVKNIIDLHKGNVKIESRQGKGTKITLTLPIVCDNQGTVL